MKKKTVLYLIIWVLALALVNVLAFAVPALNHPESWIFWLVYGVLMAALVIPGIICLITACKAKKKAVLLDEAAEEPAAEVTADRAMPLEAGEPVSLTENTPASLESERIRPHSKPLDASGLEELPKAKTRMTAEYIAFLESKRAAARELANEAEETAEAVADEAAETAEAAVETVAETAEAVAETAEAAVEEIQQ